MNDGPGPQIALAQFPPPDAPDPGPLQAIFAVHTGELHVSTARAIGWLGSNQVANATPRQGSGVIAFASSAGRLQAFYVDDKGLLSKVERREGQQWSDVEPINALTRARSGAGLAHGHLPPDNDYVLWIDDQGSVTSLRVAGNALGPALERLPSGSPLGSPGGALVAFNQAEGLLSVVFCDAGLRRLRVIWRSAVDTSWHGPALIDTLGPSLVPPNASLAAAVLGLSHWFVAYVDDGGALRAAHVVGTAAWQRSQTLSAPGFTTPGAGVAALRQTQDMISVFVVDHSGAVGRFWQHDSASTWSGPQRITGTGAAKPGAGLAAAKQSANESVLMVVAADGRPSVCWTFADGPWQGPALISQFRIDEPYVPSSTPAATVQTVASALAPVRGLDSLSLVERSTRFETWLTGPDSANFSAVFPPAYKGTDLGANTEHRAAGDAPSRLFIFFGDTTFYEAPPLELHDPAAFPPYDGDMIGIIDVPSVSPRMPMTIVPGDAHAAPDGPVQKQSFHPYSMQRAGTLGTVETPTGAFSHGGRIFVFAEVNGTRPVCYLTSSSRPESTSPFELHFEVSRTRFIQVAPWVVDNARHPGLPSNSGEGVVMIGRGAHSGETDNHFLAWMPINARRPPVRADLLFYTGIGGDGRARWSTDEFQAIAVTSPALAGYSSVSLNWLAAPGRWVLLYTLACSPSKLIPGREVLGPIVARVSRQLFEWSGEVALFDPRRDTGLAETIKWERGTSWAYGAFLLSRFHEWNSRSSVLTLRYLVSGSIPYQVHVQKAQLVIGTMRQHVFHRTANDRLEHLWWDADTGLVAAEDWSSLVPAPPMGGAPQAILTEGRLSVFYRDTAGGITQVFRDLPSGDVHLATAVAPPLPTSAAGDPVLLETLGQLHVFYRGVDGSLPHIVKALPGPDAEPEPGPFAGTLALIGPNTGTGLDNWISAATLLHPDPPLAGDPAVIETPGQQHAFYRAVNGTIQHIVWSRPGGFGRDDWTTRSGAPRAAGDPFALAADDQQHVFCRSVDGAILHLHWDSSLNAPAFENWTALAGAPLAAGEPAAMSAAGQLHVFYRSAAGSIIHFVRNPGDVRPGFDDWTAKAQAPRAHGDPTPLETPGQQHVFYRAEGGTIAHIFWQASPGSAHGVFRADNWTQRSHGALAAGRPAVLLTTGLADAPVVRILPLGDSITQGLIAPAYTASLGGYRSHLFEMARRAGKRISFVGSLFDGPLTVEGVEFPRSHEGHSGWAVRNVPGTPGIHGIDSIAADAARRGRPDIVLLMVGTNNVLFSTEAIKDARHATESLLALLDKLWAATGNALVVLAKIPPMFDPQSGAPVHKDTIDMYNEAIGALQTRHRHAKSKRLVIADMHTNVTHDMLSDGIHPNDRGYAHMASVWFAAIASRLL